MNPEKQKTMIEDSRARARAHEREVRKYKMCTVLTSLELEEGKATGWFDESEHEGKRLATRIVRKKTEEGQVFVVQVGVTAGDASVGESAEGTFVYSYGQISFAGTDVADMKTAVLKDFMHTNEKAALGGPLDSDSEKFKEIEHTVLTAESLRADGKLQPQTT